MDKETKITSFKTIDKIADRLRDDLDSSDNVLLYAYNGTGKTRLSMAFKNKGKKKNGGDTLYFNAFTEDLFTWDNDLENDKNRTLKINELSKFFNGLKELSLEERIFAHLERYTRINFKIDYEKWTISFNRIIPNPKYKLRNPNNTEPETIKQDGIKISRGEENIFIFCIFLAICELVIDGVEAYKWVKYIYIDDPISSLDENNAITIANDLSNIIQKCKGRAKVVISSHHSLFYNVMYNELRKNSRSYFLHKTSKEEYRLQKTEDTPFFHHIALLCELKQKVDQYKKERKENKENKENIQTNILNTYHFNILRSILEKTAVFFGYTDFSFCLKDKKDEDEDKDKVDNENENLYARALNIMSHGRYSIFSPVGMMPDNADLFVEIFDTFTKKYDFYFPDIFAEGDI